ncbi:hypothetical protein QBC47DRAFT_214142 [Echria macrotheca]|uniref:Uncharacterized protein n=1 Tax=Echria macrotheca TaxID=438768 RepID=A0AAJ0BBN7_9PEZI|nr:hypothetical protein QBC47DRAFT_214142 [Echria macrotheca]
MPWTTYRTYIEAGKMSETRRLPLEIQAQIVLNVYRKPPVCVFDVITPEWRVCNRILLWTQEVLKLMRVDTYTVPAPGSQGVISTAFSHGETDHLLLPTMTDPRSLGGLGPFLHRELLRSWATDCLVVVNQKKPQLGPLWNPNLAVHKLLRDDDALTLLPYEDDDDLGPGADEAGSRETKPKFQLPCAADTDEPKFGYEIIRNLALGTSSEVLDLQPRDVGTMPRSPLLSPTVQSNLERIEVALAAEQRAVLKVQWSKLKCLETLFLDLRNYSGVGRQRTLERSDIEKLAESLISALQRPLKLLAIGGLNSYAFYPRPRQLRIEDIEGVPDQDHSDSVPASESTSESRVNWWLVFRDAVRPGGKLIFFDRRVDMNEVPIYWIGTWVR